MNLLKYIIVNILDKIINDNYSFYYDIVDKLILKNNKIINNTTYYNTIFNNIESLITHCQKNNTIETILIKLRCLFEYIKKIKNVDINKKLNIFTQELLNITIDQNIPIDCNIHKLEFYKNIIKL